MEREKHIEAVQALRLAIVMAVKAGLTVGEVKGIAGDVALGINVFGLDAVEHLARTGELPEMESEGNDGQHKD